MAGRVAIDGRIILDPEFPVVAGGQSIEIDGVALQEGQRIYLAMNKQRGLVTTVSDDRGRDTVYRCLEGAGLPWLAPVGRLDKASEGLLLFSNDPAWAATVTDPASGPDKTYHVQVDQIPGPDLLKALSSGVVDQGEQLSVALALLLRSGGRNAWLEITLEEGRNRHIRRLLAAHGVGVLRLIRVAIGPLALGDLKKGEWRRLSTDEASSLAPVTS
jgi:23S rRNA pseudouridine2605 synthase